METTTTHEYSYTKTSGGFNVNFNPGSGGGNQNSERMAQEYMRRERERERIENQRQLLLNAAIRDCNEFSMSRFEIARVGLDASSLACDSAYNHRVFERAGLSERDFRDLVREINQHMQVYQAEAQKHNDYQKYALYSIILFPVAIGFFVRSSVHYDRALSALTTAVGAIERRANAIHDVNLSGSKIQVGLNRSLIGSGSFNDVDVKQQLIVAIDVPRHLLDNNSTAAPVPPMPAQYPPTTSYVPAPYPQTTSYAPTNYAPTYPTIPHASVVAQPTYVRSGC